MPKSGKSRTIFVSTPVGRGTLLKQSSDDRNDGILEVGLVVRVFFLKNVFNVCTACNI